MRLYSNDAKFIKIICTNSDIFLIAYLRKMIFSIVFLSVFRKTAVDHACKQRILLPSTIKKKQKKSKYMK